MTSPPLHLCSQDGIGERDLDIRVDRGPLAPQLWVILDGDVDVEIAALSAPAARVTLAPHAQPATAVHA